MKLFSNKNTTSAHTPIPENHVSKKKKNTYQIRFSPFMSTDLFTLCKTAPLGVIIMNGKQTQESTGWISCTQFPNPGACDMAKKQTVLREIMGEKIATQIVEYLDKETGKPVVQVFPEIIHVFDGYEENYMSRLNHASRRDLQKHIALRERLISEFMAQKKHPTY